MEAKKVEGEEYYPQIRTDVGMVLMEIKILYLFQNICVHLRHLRINSYSFSSS